MPRVAKPGRGGPRRSPVGLPAPDAGTPLRCLKLRCGAPRSRLIEIHYVELQAVSELGLETYYLGVGCPVPEIRACLSVTGRSGL